MAPVRERLQAAPLQWNIVVRQPADETLASVYNLQKALLVLAVGVIAILLILTFSLAARISLPLEKLARQAKRRRKLRV